MQLIVRDNPTGTSDVRSLLDLHEIPHLEIPFDVADGQMDNIGMPGTIVGDFDRYFVLINPIYCLEFAGGSLHNPSHNHYWIIRPQSGSQLASKCEIDESHLNCQSPKICGSSQRTGEVRRWWDMRVLEQGLEELCPIQAGRS
jgi:hypothetical protein